MSVCYKNVVVIYCTVSRDHKNTKRNPSLESQSRRFGELISRRSSGEAKKKTVEPFKQIREGNLRVAFLLDIIHVWAAIILYQIISVPVRI